MSDLTTLSISRQSPVTRGEISSSRYWLNWRVLLCGICVLLSMIYASFLISKYEGPRKSKKPNNTSTRSTEIERERRRNNQGILYEDEVWMPCLKGIHPVWLLAFRLCGFLLLLILLIFDIIVNTASIFYFYTQWTVSLVIIYFGLGSVLSMYGCYDYQQKLSGDRVHQSEETDSERGGHLTLVNVGTSNVVNNSFNTNQVLDQSRATAGFWGYVFQVIFQINAGAVMLSNSVFWFVIFPFLVSKNYDLHFLNITMHTINLVFLLGDTALSSLRFPWFRIAYFIIWSSFYVILQWVLHASITIWWPYPWMDLSSSFSPLWYASTAIMHFPCFGLFFLLIKLKHVILSKHFPLSYQCCSR